MMRMMHTLRTPYAHLTHTLRTPYAHLTHTCDRLGDCKTTRKLGRNVGYR